MSDSPFASLNPKLLARKGGAKPAMRSHHGSAPGVGSAGNPAQHLNDLNDLGWNDMGAEAELVAPSGKPPVLQQQEAISEKLAAVPQKSKRKPAAVQGKRAAFTLRLDAERHLKLRLASTIRGCSAQVLVTEALDALLAEMENLDSLAAQAKRK